jgi:hypothetical protein
LAQYSIFWSDEAFDNAAFAFSADELNIYFTSPVAGTYRPLIEGDSFSLLLPSIFPVHSELFNYIVTSSTFPLDWKISNVIPMPKGHSPIKKSDYHPISFYLSLQRLLKMLCTSKW